MRPQKLAKRRFVGLFRHFKLLANGLLSSLNVPVNIFAMLAVLGRLQRGRLYQ
jgi:hypothetical protein